jgi:hypothetical protein
MGASSVASAAHPDRPLSRGAGYKRLGDDAGTLLRAKPCWLRATYETLHGHTWRHALRGKTGRNSIFDYQNTADDDMRRLHKWLDSVADDKHAQTCQQHDAVSDYTRLLSAGTTWTCEGSETACPWVTDWLLQHTVPALVAMCEGCVVGDAVTHSHATRSVIRVQECMALQTDKAFDATHVGTLVLLIPSHDLTGGTLQFHYGAGNLCTPAAPCIALVPIGVPYHITAVTRGCVHVFRAALHATDLCTPNSLCA